ncbi:hypothetical protein A5772_07350 [Mycolicibacter sinensis]|uniref:Uncharacterized protein n=1 Tax=Mycolicibacter sinensis (strain JDM601) TaxID=875328 RepID=A0A1A2EDI7_MYCSD|nr:hypothetical protein A5772_07350 [Mycolicibacter sinensis]OBG03085.1 hypothetical protein A5771_14215 [Mycolicibacter sinensis]
MFEDHDLVSRAGLVVVLVLTLAGSSGPPGLLAAKVVKGSYRQAEDQHPDRCTGNRRSPVAGRASQLRPHHRPGRCRRP